MSSDKKPIMDALLDESGSKDDPSSSYWIKTVVHSKGIYEINQLREFVIYALLDK